MKTISLRNLPPQVEKAIRTKARQKGISVNKAVIELLEERLGVLQPRSKAIHDDLDHLAGAWSAREAKGFEQTVQVGRQIDKDLWR